MKLKNGLLIGFGMALFLAGLLFAGYSSELLKSKIPAVHRAVLIIGFIYGAYAASAWLIRKGRN